MTRIDYTLKDHRRARRITLSVRRDGTVLVTKPRWVSKRIAEAFVARSGDWIAQVRARHAAHPQTSRIESSKEEYKKLKGAALALVEQRLRHFNAHYQFTYGTISIRNQSTRWGSCSHRGTLSFNYRLVYLPPALLDYIVVHELCHLKEMNHGKRFWALVARTIPDHIARRARLRAWSRALLVE